MGEFILEMTNIGKEFPGVKALDDVQLKVKPGEIHALMGENGAGKSTLMKCLTGIYHRDAGDIFFKGKSVSYNTTLEALNDGLSMIHQELSPVPERTVAENVWLGRQPMKNAFMVDHKKMEEETAKLFEKLKVEIDPREIMKNLTVSQMQMVEIAKAVSYDSKIVIMDEPTSSLTSSEVEHLFDIMLDLKKKNIAIIYISHKMDEIFRICDTVTTMRDGQYVATDNVKDIDMDTLVSKMVGREITNQFPKVDCEIGDVVLKVENLTSGKMVQNVSFELKRGEILGFAGLVGAGRSETMQAIFGLRHKQSGTITLDGKKLNINSPQDAINSGIDYLTEDRRAQGIVGIRSIVDNMTLSNLKDYGVPLNRKKMIEDTDTYIDKLRIKTPGREEEMKNLSGGNQQKVLLGRLLLTNPDILIVDEPTRGIDVGAKSEIHTLLCELAKQGKAIIMISSEMPEIMGMSDRMVIMYEGRVTGILDRKDYDQELIMKYATDTMEG